MKWQNQNSSSGEIWNLLYFVFFLDKCFFAFTNFAIFSYSIASIQNDLSTKTLSLQSKGLILLRDVWGRRLKSLFPLMDFLKIAKAIRENKIKSSQNFKVIDHQCQAPSSNLNLFGCCFFEREGKMKKSPVISTS